MGLSRIDQYEALCQAACKGLSDRLMSEFRLEISPRRRVLTLAAPVMLAMGSQNLVNIVDILMVSQLGEPAVAAVGLGAFILFSLQALTLGASSGVQITTARAQGFVATEESGSPLLGTLLLCAIVLPIASTALYLAAPGTLPYLHDDPEVVVGLLAYTQARIWSLTFVAVNFAFRGYLSAVEETRTFLYVSLTMHGANIALNYVLIFGHFGFPAMGVEGAGWATTLATALGAACYLVLLRHRLGAAFRAAFRHLRAVMLIAAPYGLQQALHTVGGAILLWIIGRLGTLELAAGTVVINLMLFATLPAIGIGIAAASLVSRAADAAEPRTMHFWLRETVKLALLFCATVGALIWAFSGPLLGWFLSDPIAQQIAWWPLHIVAVAIVVDGAGLVLSQALYSTGGARPTLVVSITLQWLVFLPTAYVLGPWMNHGLDAIMLAYLVYRSVLALLLWRLWRRQVARHSPPGLA